ncbi:hypothetical protein E2C01_095816 [Portunus trituberculatus]|uniref:Uncharacterized protein n=1 Tax=Portunus trituberculatus TaxID=210409 RepID=A0A5B7K014_PORTR|nr:hypothetical protein [Portunus trituberculatus]
MVVTSQWSRVEYREAVDRGARAGVLSSFGEQSSHKHTWKAAR